MSDSHDPIKDAIKHLFGRDKKEDDNKEQPQNSSPASDVTAAAAALGEQASAQAPAAEQPAEQWNSQPAEQASTQPAEQPAEPAPTSYSNPFANNPTPVQAQEPAPTTYTNPFANDAVPAPAPEPAQERPAENAATAAVEEPAPAPAPASNPDIESINGHAVGFAFLRYYKEHPEIGLPVDEQHGNVGGYQMFEHAILHWDGSNVQAEQRGGGGGDQGGGQRTYTVQPGDNLSAIAQQFYGDGGQWRRIFDANRDKISDPDLIHPGQQFVIP